MVGTKMKISEVMEVLRDFECDVIQSDLNMEVRLGCDCGCGGDSYDIESWEDMCRRYDEAIEQFKKFCDQMGFEYDLEY